MNEKIYLPLVSIIIPVYNGSDYMREAIDSALAQTYENIEIIVVNDGSTDNTDDIALSYGEKIRYFRKENGGVSSALNLGIKEMHGEYFSWLSHDDSYYPEKISVQMQALKNVENTKTLLICDSEFMDKDSKTLNKKSRCLVSANENTLIPWNQALHILLDQGSFNGCSFLIPKSAFDECGLFDESLRFNQDSYMWTNLFLAGYSLYYVPQVCVRNRIHNNQVTQKRQDLFHKDCEAVSGVLIPRLMQITNKNDRFLFEYSKYNAKYNNKKIVKNVSQSADKNHFNTVERLIVLIFLMYGKIRPALRKVYYLLKIKA